MDSEVRMNRWVVLSTFATLLLALGCGSSSGHPDTGAGTGQPVPPTENCVDFCQRIATCAVTLCNEDTHSHNYDGFDTLLAQQCETTCTDAQVMSAVPPSGWQCIFQSSCRQVFEHDACSGMAHYNC